MYHYRTFALVFSISAMQKKCTFLIRVVQYCIAFFYNIPIKFTLEIAVLCSYFWMNDCFVNVFCSLYYFSVAITFIVSVLLVLSSLTICGGKTSRLQQLIRDVRHDWTCDIVCSSQDDLVFPEQIHSSSLTPSFTHLRVGIWLSCAAGLRIIFKVHATNKITNIKSTKSYRRNTHNNEQTNNTKY